mmetsp:Transcript_14545/g.35169  ORF Transcript_14545/g.35169 Transcript_14545/m.35169 type:complete len:270 (+) Transcript_14545:206-1015(+)
MPTPMSQRKRTRSGDTALLGGGKGTPNLLACIQCAVIFLLVMMTCCWMYVVIQFRKPAGLQNNLLDYKTLHQIVTPMHTFGGNQQQQQQQASGLRKKGKNYIEHEHVGDGDDDADAEEHPMSIEEIKDQHAAAAAVEKEILAKSQQSQKQVDSTTTTKGTNNDYAKHKISTKNFLKKSLFSKEAIHDQVVKKRQKGQHFTQCHSCGPKGRFGRVEYSHSRWLEYDHHGRRLEGSRALGGHFARCGRPGIGRGGYFEFAQMGHRHKIVWG